MVSFPVILKTSHEARAESALYYLVAANGVFQVKETASYRAVTRAEPPLPGLLPERERLVLRCPPVPAPLLEEVLAFFRAVHERHDGEAIVLLFHRPETGEYRVGVPEQRIPQVRDWQGRWRSLAALDYGDVERPEGFLRFGTIHSHASLGAYASSTDCEDERFQDGLHAVYGHLDQREPSRAACFVASGVRFRLAPETVLEPCAVPRRPARPDWLARVTLDRGGAAAWAPRAGSGR